MLRVGLDGRHIERPGGTGVATYATVLAAACQHLGAQTEVLIDRQTSEDEGPTHTPLRKVARFLDAALPERALHRFGNTLISPDVFRVAQVHFDLYRRPLRLNLRDRPPAIMHWTYPMPLILAGVPNLVTIHDLIPLRQPELTGISPNRMRRLLASIIRSAARIVTVSETVRAEIIAEFGLDPERVANLYQAFYLPETLLYAAEKAEPICPPGSFICFGTVETRKNIGRLIQAHAASGVATPLVIIGPDGQGATAELAHAARHPNGPMAVRRVPWSSRPSLILAIRQARAVLFPSLAEGFGLPIVEAMALATPVMTSRGGATEEIAGGAALLVDPRDIGDMAAAIAALDKDADLRDRLRGVGSERAKLFTLDAYAQRLRTLYETVNGIRAKAV